MGALHAGHASLINAAAEYRRQAGASAPIFVSIFVNPTQFNDPADLARYPRTLEADIDTCQAAGADAVFAPALELMYPPDSKVSTPPLPPVATEPELEDAIRPGHFAGVCQVVSRLFALTRPAAAFFGEKDWQQLQVVRAMAGVEFPGVRIIAVPTFRDSDTLATSSRNVFLSANQRLQALAIPRALHAAQASTTIVEGERAMRGTLREAGLHIEYAVIRDAESLLTPVSSRPARALIAIRLPNLRLIDNAPWPG